MKKAADLKHYTDIERDAMSHLHSYLYARDGVHTHDLNDFINHVRLLPPHRVLVLCGEVMSSIAENSPSELSDYTPALKRLGGTMTQDMGAEFVQLCETDPQFHKENAGLIAENLCQISDVILTIAQDINPATKS